MRLNIVAGLLTTLLVAGCAVAQSPKPADEHAGHHPAGSTQSAGAVTQTAPAATAAPTPDAFDHQMKAMQDMHRKMQAAKTPAERAALMDEHMKLMQSGMAMMGSGDSGGMGMGMGMGMMQQGAQAKPAVPAAAGSSGMGGMMGMHAHMERRMAMMEQMMQMMVDRQAAMPSK
ncbi:MULTISPECIES: hypothetical protein [unclassified Acidovorax]|uniref:hypothetical protein n=1 Tax=unclassified Acidovorax TaxID=2684926 RepID=UPI0006FAED76|nr:MULTISPECIES: hypothetical protein [unclassified Acidovorax]KRB42386.1 hypothetical protein ASD94_01450 [Acidovorax sp. Root70]PUA95306.1 hypothetical protein C8C99_0105 [Acidovorax sp. 107]